MRAAYKYFLVLLIVIVLFSTVGCGIRLRGGPAIIKIKGSDTLKILLERLATEYMSTHSNVSIHVFGGGTGAGIKALTKGNADLCAASRPLKPQEASHISQRYRSVGLFFRIAKDALNIYLNPKNPVKNLTTHQLKLIFTGGIKNWKEVGGNDEPIRVLIRNPNSGTFLYFKEHILGGASYLKDARTLATTNNIVAEILQHENAIGYGGNAYGPNVYHCRINGIRPTEGNIRRDLYPISRYLFLYSIQKPEPVVAAFVDWVLSPAGQKIVRDVGYFPLWSE